MTDTPASRPAGFRHAEIGVGGEEQTRVLAGMLDLQARQPAVVRLREWALARLAPEPGETVVDVGSGVGEVVVRLARAVGPTGRAVGVEPNPALRAIADERASAEGAASATFVDGVAGDLPFDDGSVDAVTCERVLQHLDDPEGAVREMARVLRPGGRVVLLDSDWATSVMHPGDQDVVARYQAATWAGFANPFSGRRLRSQLRAAGFDVDPDIGSAALVLPDEALRGGMIGAGGPGAVASGAVTRDELDTLLADISAAVDSGEAFVSVTMFAAVGRKPA
ncbi:methyltransferase domain-containing protein [Oryzobacter sp. R7]|uniref:methyltransferase domain-containing protein n=1 Tax=Oryzobacter faecalis TaxID=3388656 RepID=UPI00398D3076